MMINTHCGTSWSMTGPTPIFQIPNTVSGLATCIAMDGFPSRLRAIYGRGRSTFHGCNWSAGNCWNLFY